MSTSRFGTIGPLPATPERPIEASAIRELGEIERGAKAIGYQVSSISREGPDNAFVLSVVFTDRRVEPVTQFKLRALVTKADYVLQLLRGKTPELLTKEAILNILRVQYEENSENVKQPAKTPILKEAAQTVIALERTINEQSRGYLHARLLPLEPADSISWIVVTDAYGLTVLIVRIPLTLTESCYARGVIAQHWHWNEQDIRYDKLDTFAREIATLCQQYATQQTAKRASGSAA